MKFRTLGFIVTLALGSISAPLPAEAQAPAKVLRIGTLAPGARPAGPDWRRRWAVVEGLRELGWVEGQNIVIEDRWADAKPDRLPALAAELVRLKVDVILTRSWPAAVAAKQATTTIPIVIITAGDPVATGLVASLARPGGNITGLADLATELSAKRLDLLKETVPKLSRVAVLWNSADGGMTLRFKSIQAAAPTLGVTVRPLGVQEPADFEQAFAAMTQERPEALFVVSDVLTVSNRKRIFEFAAHNRLPSMYEGRQFVADGGLISYGPSFPDLERRGAAFVDKILKGAKPADLPVEQPTRVELVVNLKTAKALGLTIPQSILIRADEVIQ
ncbi:MAG TPA: ABC transporter substrate-binding protein [Methylomirabilota bacterium]|jgi:putative ABC transport system substrate-binding protein|nr:ABC transporter substrate-binding protein [Methylomirabilota bacterium]